MRAIDYCIEHYFRQPNYWTVDGRLFYSIFRPDRFIKQLGGPAKTRELLAEIDAKLQRAGLPTLHWNAITWDTSPVVHYQEAGFLTTTTYNITNTGKTSAAGTQDYKDMLSAHMRMWKAIAATALPYCPVVTMGWDVTRAASRRFRSPS